MNQQLKAINRNPLSNSTSKQLYSFPKARRFRDNIEPVCSTSFYEVKDPYQNQRTFISFGKGHKVDFSKLGTQTPGPNRYNIAMPKKSYCKSQCFMGPGRVYQQPKQINPPPGHYEIPSALNKTSYSIRAKLEPKIRSISPGPGAYHIEVKSAVHSVILNSKSSRSGRSPDPTPGPQHYRPKTELSADGKYMVFTSTSGPKFPAQPRFFTQTSDFPGPGQYNIPGELGFY